LQLAICSDLKTQSRKSDLGYGCVVIGCALWNRGHEPEIPRNTKVAAAEKVAAQTRHQLVRRPADLPPDIRMRGIADNGNKRECHGLSAAVRA
jgi:hypothetical protein